MKKFLTIILAFFAATTAYAQCPAKNEAFNSGETLLYDLYFNWKFVWLKAGSASLNISNTTYMGKDAYRTRLITRGSKRADRFFIMRDTIMSYTTHEMVPMYYKKAANEGGSYRTDEVWYSYIDGICHVKQRHRNKRGTIKVKNESREDCIYDMLSIMLKARSMNISNMNKGYRYHFQMTDGGKTQDEVLIFRGRSTFQVENSPVKYRCLVFSYVEKDDDGKEKEVVTFYVTDDKNRLPVRLDLNLKFGTAKAFLTGATNIRNPQTAKISGN
jgi:hypothetical protein